MWDSDIDGVAALRHCTCDGHGECPEPFCILPMHDVTAKWGEHVGQGGREWR